MTKVNEKTNMETLTLDNYTLEVIENDVFFKQEYEEVTKATDDAFWCYLRSELCDDIDARNKALDAWMSIRKTQAIIKLKELPDNILTLEINLEF